MDRPDPRVGTVLAGRYKILERTTSGSMGVVYKAERVALKRAVAIKFLNEGYAGTDDGLRRFEVEARATSRLEHPNCVPVTDYGVDQGAPYLVMDFVKGVTLAQLLSTEWRLVPARAVAIMRQVASGLGHAHAQRILHRDVKPANILIAPVEGHGEHVRIVDFGLAKLRDEGSFTTGIAIGTPSYMSPEQTLGESADERADIYACGIILYELLTGAKPFQSESPFEVMRMHREAVPLPLSTAAAGVAISAGLEAVVMKAVAKARNDRFASMAELQAALDAVDEAHGAPRRRGGRTPQVAIGAAVLAAAAIGAWLIWGRGQPKAASAPAPEVALATEPSPGPRSAGPAGDPPAPAPPRERTPPAIPDAAGPSEATTAAASEPPTEVVPAAAAAVAKMRALAGQGELRAAIAGLERLRRSAPTEPSVHYALGNLYAERQRWPQAVKAYLATVRLDPAYRDDARLTGDVVEALGSNAHALAAKVIAQNLGAAALPRLDEASRSTNRKLRARARKLRAQVRALAPG